NTANPADKRMAIPRLAAKNTRIDRRARRDCFMVLIPVPRTHQLVVPRIMLADALELCKEEMGQDSLLVAADALEDLDPSRQQVKGPLRREPALLSPPRPRLQKAAGKQRAGGGTGTPAQLPWGLAPLAYTQGRKSKSCRRRTDRERSKINMGNGLCCNSISTLGIGLALALG